MTTISLTGSSSVGMGLKGHMAGRDVRVQTEMGTKNAVLVLADADLERAADAINTISWDQAGQCCTATSPVVIHERVCDELLDRLIQRANAVSVDP